MLAGVVVGVVVTVVIMSAVKVDAGCTDEPCDNPPCCNGDVNGDAAIDIADAISTLTYLFVGGPGPEAIECSGEIDSSPLPATGQTQCYMGVLNWEEIDCSNTGQDGFYQNGCPMEGRFVDNEDGTVTDTCTGLTWQQATMSASYTWAEALRLCESFELGGETDWRLPNVRELQSIVDYGRVHPAIDPVFSATPTPYWSSSSMVNGPDSAWLVDFNIGLLILGGKDSHTLVRAVRG